MEKFYYNPISLNERIISYFSNIQTLHVYKEDDKNLKGGGIIQYDDW